MMGRPPRRLAAVIEPETGAGVNPVPAFGFLARSPPGGTLAPSIAFANVPGIQWDDQSVRLPGQRHRLRGRRLIEFGAEPLGAFALAVGFPGQRGGRYMHAGQMRQDHTGLGHGQFADHQRGQILHARRVPRALRQPQGGVGRHAPLAGAFAVAPGALDRDRTSAGAERAPMAGRATREGVPADRAERRRGGGFGLGPELQGVAEQFPNVLGDLDFEMAEVLVTCAYEALDRKFQRARHARRQWRERGGGASSEGGGSRLAAGNGHAQNVQRTLPCKKLRRLCRTT